MRKKFRIEMEKLHNMLLKMDITIKNNIELMIKAIDNNDPTLAKQVIANDDVVDILEIKIEETCIDILIRQQPVARDLREVAAVLKMITDLERISDYCSSVCEHFLEINNLNSNKIIAKIVNLCKNAKEMFIGMVECYLEQDTAKIATVSNMDSVSDRIYRELKELITTNYNKISISNTINLILMGKSLERMADHITNVCDYINFKITGSFKV